MTTFPEHPLSITARALRASFAVAMLFGVQPSPVHASVVLRNEHASLTVEGWGNAALASNAARARADDANWQLDGAVRALVLAPIANFGSVGVRVVEQGFVGALDDARASERSLLWSGSLGRLEYGDRMGLPDVLAGYAPNPFQFTSAEFGPASGLSLDPGGGIVSRFTRDARRDDVDSLAVLGFGASLFGDESRKLLYVSPKRAGFLGGLSYASHLTDSPGAHLVQAALVHETYWDENELRIGGAFARASAARSASVGTARSANVGTARSANVGTARSANSNASRGAAVNSFYGGATLTLNNDWSYGVAVTWNPDAPRTPLAGWRGDGAGVTASVNYNHGPWTFGGYVQGSRGRVIEAAATQQLRAAEIGASYRINTKLRFFGAVYRDAFSADHRARMIHATHLIAGMRVTL